MATDFYQKMQANWDERKVKIAIPVTLRVPSMSLQISLTLPGPRLRKIIGVKGWLYLFQQRAHNKLRSKVATGLFLFSIFTIPLQNFFLSLSPAMCRWSDLWGISHLMQLWEQLFELNWPGCTQRGARHCRSTSFQSGRTINVKWRKQTLD